jgi:hypothetical protein
VLRPPALRGWCLVQAPQWGASRAGGAVWGSQGGKVWTSHCFCFCLLHGLPAACGLVGKVRCAGSAVYMAGMGGYFDVQKHRWSAQQLHRRHKQGSASPLFGQWSVAFHLLAIRMPPPLPRSQPPTCACVCGWPRVRTLTKHLMCTVNTRRGWVAGVCGGVQDVFPKVSSP